MHVFRWTGLNGQAVKREFKNINDAMDFAQVLRGFRIDYKHTFEE